MVTARLDRASTTLRFVVVFSLLELTCFSTASRLHNVSITAESTKISAPRRLRRYFQSPVNDQIPPPASSMLASSMRAFGSIYHRVGQDEWTLCGEGVLLSSHIVLTHIDCLLQDPSLIFFTIYNRHYTFRDYRYSSPYAILELVQPPDELPTTYPFLSWTAAWQTTDPNWIVLPEMIKSQSSTPYRLSTPYVYVNGEVDIRTLTNCEFDDKKDMFALSCPNAEPQAFNKMVKTGSSLFRMEDASPVARALTVSSMVMRGESFHKCQRSFSHQHLYFLNVVHPITQHRNPLYLCGPRLTYDDVLTINTKANEMGHSLFDQNVIPRGRRCKAK